MTRVVVVGAGIGGLVTALALQRADADVTVVERSPAVGRTGAGVQLGPSATRLLIKLGLFADLDGIGVRPEGVRFRRWADDRVLDEHSLGDEVEHRQGGPHWDVYRPDLLGVLARELRPGTVRFRTRCLDVAVGRGGRAQVRYDDGTAEIADVVVGADGEHSRVRAATVGDARPVYTGLAAYRTIVPSDRLSDRRHVVDVRVGPGRHLVTYFMGRDAWLLNVECVVPAEQWNVPGSAYDLRAQFTGWSPGLRRLLDQVDGPTYRRELFDREPLERWSTGPITLVGDAAHPMPPDLGQGTTQAIEDAIVLAGCLTCDDDVHAALRHYEELRIPRARQLHRMMAESRASFHLPDGPEQRARDARFATPCELLNSYEPVLTRASP